MAGRPSLRDLLNHTTHYLPLGGNPAQAARNRRRAVLARLGAFAALLAAAGTAHAHRPFFSDGKASDAEHALVIREAGVSQVVYHENTSAAPRLWVTFTCSAGDEIALQIGVPVLEGLEEYRPSFALVGPGLPEANLPFAAPAGTGARVWHTSEIRKPRLFHEPFTGTDSWILKEVRLKAPRSGRYYAVAFSPGNKPGKLWLAVGSREKWLLSDLSRFAEIRRRVRAFHELTGTPAGEPQAAPAPPEPDGGDGSVPESPH